MGGHVGHRLEIRSKLLPRTGLRVGDVQRQLDVRFPWTVHSLPTHARSLTIPFRVARRSDSATSPKSPESSYNSPGVETDQQTIKVDTIARIVVKSRDSPSLRLLDLNSAGTKRARVESNGVRRHRPRPPRRGAQVLAQESPPRARHHDLSSASSLNCFENSSSFLLQIELFAFFRFRASWPSRRRCRTVRSILWSGTASSPARKA